MTKFFSFICRAAAVLAVLPILAAAGAVQAQNEAFNNENVYAVHFTVTHHPGTNGCGLSGQHAVISVKARFRCRDYNFSCWENVYPFNEDETREDDVWRFTQNVALHYYCDDYPAYEPEANRYGLDHYDLECTVYTQSGYTVITESTGSSDNPSGDRRTFVVTMPAHEVLRNGGAFVVGCETVNVRMEPLCKPHIENMETQFTGWPYSYTVSARTDCMGAGAGYSVAGDMYVWTYMYPGLEEPRFADAHGKDFTLSLDKYPDLPLGENITVRLLNGEESNGRNTRVVRFYPQIPQPIRTGDQIIPVGGRWDSLRLVFDRPFNPAREEQITKITVYSQVGVINDYGFGESTPVFQYPCRITSLKDDLTLSIALPAGNTLGPGRYYVTAEGSAQGKNNHPDNNTPYGSEIMSAMFRVTGFNVRTNELNIHDVVFTEPDCPGGYGRVQMSIASSGKTLSTPVFLGLMQEEGLSVFREFSFSKMTGSGVPANTYRCNTVEENWNTFIAVTDGGLYDAILAYAPSTDRIQLQPSSDVTVTLTPAQLATHKPTAGAKVGYFTVHYTSPEEMVIPVTKQNMTGYYAVNGTLHSTDDGYIEVRRDEMTGGTPPYTFYYYAPDKTPLNQDLLELPVGNYSVEVFDAHGCSTTKAVNIKNAGHKLKVRAEIEEDIACHGGSGILKAVLENASSSQIVFQWYRDGVKVEGGRQAMLHYAVPGSYKVEAVCLETGLVSTDEVVLTQPDSLYIYYSYVQDVTCFGAKTGIIRVQLKGGVPGYSFTWDDNISGSERTGLGAGVYGLLATDANGCSVRASYTVDGPVSPVKIVVDSVVNAYYDASDYWRPGQVLAHAEGGTPGYMDIWAENADIANLSPGTYRLVTWDAYHCQAYETVTVGQMPPLQISLVQDSRNLCYGSATASCHVEVEGGVPPYHIKWSNGASDAHLDHLGEGAYSVAVTDKVGAFRIAELNITQPPLLDISPRWVQNPGYGGCRGDDCEPDRFNGVIEAGVGGGTSPYTYEWRKDGVVWDEAGGSIEGAADGEAGSSAGSDGIVRLEGLGGGSYLLTVTDANSCKAQFVATLLYTPVLRTQITVEQEVLCHGAATGRLAAAASGGKPPYSYRWYRIPEPEQKDLYNWDTWENTVGDKAVLEQVPAGWYGVKVTDSSGISSLRYVRLNQRNAVQITLDSLCDPSYSGAVNGVIPPLEPDGYLACRLSGGTLPYTWSWEKAGDAGSFYTAPLVRNDLAAGIYTLRVEDSAGCTAEETFTLHETEPLVCTLAITDSISCHGFKDGAAAGAVSGGKPPYFYTWLSDSLADEVQRPLAANAGILKTGLGTGKYTLKMEDAGRVISSFEIELPEPDTLTLELVSGNSPCYGDSSGSVVAAVFGGSSPYKIFFNGKAADTVTMHHDAGRPYGEAQLTGLENARVETVATDRNGCRAQGSVTVKAPEKLRLEGKADDPGYGGCQWQNEAENPSDGTIETSLSGGTEPYSLKWNTGDTTASVSGLDTGHYVLRVHDSHGCETEISFVLNRLKPLRVQLAQTSSVSCYGFADASLKAVTEGGTPPYRYRWFKDDVWFTAASDGDSALATALGAGVYKVHVSDANGIISRDSIVISQPEPLRCRGTVTDATAWHLCNGSLCAEATGGTPPYSYSRLPETRLSQPTDSACLYGLGRGHYLLQIKDAKGCEIFPDFTVSSPDSLYIVSSAVQNTKAETDSGSIYIRIKGGLKPYFYRWENEEGETVCEGSTGKDLTEAGGLLPGTYRLHLKDSGGAEVHASFTVNTIGRLSTALLVLNDPSCPGSADAAIQSFVQGGVPPYRREWQRWINGRYGFETLPDTGVILKNITAGQYRFFAYDAWADTVCGMTFTHDPLPMSAHGRMLHHARKSSDKPKALDLPDVEVLVWVENGQAPYEYFWNDPNLQGNDVWLYSNRHYEVSIRDANGCEIFYDLDTLLSDNLEISVTQVSPVLCHGGKTAAAQVTIQYGRAPFEISWSTGDTTHQAAQLAAGTYTVSVRDAMGTFRTEAIEIAEPEPLQLQAVLQNPSCFGLADGSISLNLQGGTGFLQTYWNTRNESRFMNGLNEGVYSVTVQDQNQCSVSDTFTLKAPARLQARVATDDIECPDESGRIRYGVEGGTAPYRYFGSFCPDSLCAETQITGATERLLENPVIEPAQAGYHRFTVQDSMGCEWDTVVQLVSPSYPEYRLDSVRYLCQGQDIRFGIAPLRFMEQADYLWTYPDGSRSFDSVITTAQAGTHNLLIVRDGRCFFRDSVRVEGFSDSIEAEFWVSSQIFSGESCLLVNLSQYQPDSIVWTFPEEVAVLNMEGNYAEVMFPAAGLYTLTMTSYKGLCSEQLIKTVTVSESKSGGNPNTASLHDAAVWKLYPNPSRRECTLQVQSGSAFKVRYRLVSAATGHCVEQGTFDVEGGGIFKKNLFNEHAPAGLYLLMVEYGQVKRGFKIIRL